MVSTRAKKDTDSAETGEKRAAAPSKAKTPSKKAKKEKNGKLEVGQDGEVGLKHEEENDEEKKEEKDGNNKVNDEVGAEQEAEETKDDVKGDEEEAEGKKDEQQERTRSGPGGTGTKQEGDEVDLKAKETSPGGELDEPKHGTLESGHIYFLYRPKIDVEEVDSVDDVSKFHILLIPTSAPHNKGHYHRIIEVGKKKLPDPGAKRQIIWGLVGSVGTDKAALKPAFGEYSYETKTRGTRTQPAARPAARGHYILHSPRDELADSPSHNRQRDFKSLLAYEITTPAHEDFGNVQSELGIEEKGAVVLSVKEPSAPNNNNPRAANIPREKRAHYPPHLQSLFQSRRWIAVNPPSFLDYTGSELLIMTSPHALSDSLGKDGEEVMEDMDHDAEKEKESVEGAMKELGMSKKDTEIEALEGVWA